MDRLDHLTLEDLWGLLDEIDNKTPAQRVLVAISHKRGDTNQELATRHNVSPKTVRNWLDRFENQPLEKAPYDGARSGRPAKLSNEQRNQFFEDLKRPPHEFGYEYEDWSTELAKRHLEHEFGVNYSLVHIRRLIKEVRSP